MAVCVIVAMATSGAVLAQSFFERLFGSGERRPVQLAVSEPRRSLVSVHVERPAEARATGVHLNSDRAADSGDVVQSMCVRSCDGFYWPVRFPVARRDLSQDAGVCLSTCGTQAKLYTRAGPGVEAEEMRDADGVSYGASATAFAYRRGLVNGCSCRPMPWSASERARHEGYALVEAEKAIRLAQSEADAKTETANQTELERLSTFAVAPTEATVAAVSDTNVDGGLPVGPAEAAAIAAFVKHGPLIGAADGVAVSSTMRRRARGFDTSARRVVRSPPPRRRNAQVATAGWGF